MAESTIYPWTEAEMAQWKSEGNVTVISATYKDKVYHAAFKEPDYPVLRNSSSFVHKNDIPSAGELIFESCWLAGSPEVKSNGFLKIGACNYLIRNVEIPIFEETPLGKP